MSGSQVNNPAAPVDGVTTELRNGQIAIAGVTAAAGQPGGAATSNIHNIVNNQCVSVTAAPQPTDDGYEVGTIWVNTNVTPNQYFICDSNVTGAAVWREIAVIRTDGSLLAKVAPTRVTYADEATIIPSADELVLLDGGGFAIGDATHSAQACAVSVARVFYGSKGPDGAAAVGGAAGAVSIPNGTSLISIGTGSGAKGSDFVSSYRGGAGGDITAPLIVMRAGDGGGTSLTVGSKGGSPGTITTSGGSGFDGGMAGGNGGKIDTHGFMLWAGGSILTSAGTGLPGEVKAGTGGSIDCRSGSGSNQSSGNPGNGGSLLLKGGDTGSSGPCGPGANAGTVNACGGKGSATNVAIAGGVGGTLDMSGSDASGVTAGVAGGSVITKAGGGGIDLTGSGSIQFGLIENRITLVGTAGSNSKTITLPNATGTVCVSQKQSASAIFTALAANTSEEFDIGGFTGLATDGSHTVVLGLPVASSIAGTQFTAWVKDATTVRFRRSNTTTAATTGGTFTIFARVIL